MTVQGKEVKVWYEKVTSVCKKTGKPQVSYTGRTFAVIWSRNIRHVGVSVCSANDRFDKKYGRSIAINRALFSEKSHGTDIPLPIELDTFTRRNLGTYYATIDITRTVHPILRGVPNHVYLPQPKTEQPATTERLA